MNRKQIEYELSRIIEIRDDVLFSKVVDFILRKLSEAIDEALSKIAEFKDSNAAP